MLRKYSVFMMVLLVAASVIGTNGVYQYVEGQGSPAPQQQPAQKATYAQ
jgi:hypothetical protein